MNEYGANSVPYFFMIDFEMEKSIVRPLHEIGDDLQFDFSGDSLRSMSKGDPIEFTFDPLDKHIYDHAFELVQHEIQYGNSFLLNLTFPTEIHLKSSLYDVFQKASAKYKVYWKDKMTCFSPETFIQIKDGVIYTFPMKGTIDATIPNAEQKLLESKKEKAEHFTIVDLLRNDLSQVATNISVDKFRYIDHIKTNRKSLLQVSSQISGTFSDDWKSRIGDIFGNLLPAGSISGAPKKKTLEIIRLAEIDKRGFYTGIAGVFDGESVDSTVMIRYIEKRGNQYFFRSGGGITFMSNKEEEYQELIDKIYIPIS